MPQRDALAKQGRGDLSRYSFPFHSALRSFQRQHNITIAIAAI